MREHSITASSTIFMLALIFSASSLPMASLRSEIFFFRSSFLSWGTASPYCSLTAFSAVYTTWSALFLASTASLRRRSSSWCSSASLVIRLISASLSPPLLWIVIACSFPVPLSFALTFTMPLASMSKVTSIWGVPRGAGGIPTRSNCPSSLFWLAISRSPWNTLIPTMVWLSAAVEKTWDFLVGMVLLRLIRRVNTPPRVSMPKLSGVTSSRSTSLTSPFRTPPWIAAPIATTSSGFTPLKGSFLKMSRAMSTTLGIRVIPPTSTTSWICSGWRPASARHFLHGSTHFRMRGSTKDSYFARVRVTATWTGPSGPPLMKGRLMSVCLADDSSILAFSQASRIRCRAILSLEMSKPLVFLKSSSTQSVSRLSKSSPPRKVSPLVAFTSNTPPAISRMEISKVPPPRSNTAIVLLPLVSLSRP
eukprot:RCo049919